MATGLRIGIDWNRDGLICFNAASADNLNGLITFLPQVLDYSTYDYQVIAGGETLTIEDSTTLPDIYYGLNHFKVVTSSATLDGMRVFKQSGNHTIPVDIPSGQTVDYYFRFWFRAEDFVASEQLLWRVYSGDGATLEASGTVDYASTWQGVTTTVVSLTGATTTNLSLWLSKSFTATTLTMYFSGFMFFQDPVGGGFTVPTNFNTGDSLDKYDNVTPDTSSVFWSAGLENYQAVAPAHRPQFTLLNKYADRKYSTEYSGSPLFGILPNDLLCRIIDIDNDIPFFTGQIDMYDVTTSIKGQQDVFVELKSDFARIMNLPIVATLEEATTTGAIIADYLQIADSTIDVSQIDTGLTTVNYFGDNSKLGDVLPQQAQGLLQYLTQLTTAERGKIYPDGYGRIVFRDRDWLINNTVSATYSDDFVIDEFWSFGQTLVNQVIVICYPRVEGTSITLSELDNDITIPAGEVRTFKTIYTNADNIRIGGKTITTPTAGDYVITGGSPVLTASKGGEESEWTIDNTAGTSDAVLSTFTVKGLPVSSFNGLEVIADDVDSQNQYGIKSLTLDLKAIDDPNIAFAIAQRVLARFNIPQGEFRFVGLTKEWNSADSIALLSLGFGDRVTLEEAQRGHSRDYLIVGWSHGLTGMTHNIGLLLEVATNSLDILVDENFATDLGVLTSVDTGSRFTVTGGAVVVASGTGTSYLYDDNRTMSNGMALLVRFDRTSGTATYAKMSTLHTDLVGHQATATITPSNGAGGITASTWSNDAFNLIIIHVADDLELYLHNGRVQYLGDGDTASTLDLGMAIGASDSGAIEHFRVAELGDDWATTTQAWADHFDSTPNGGDTVTASQADHLIFIDWTPVTGEIFSIFTRRQNDKSNIEIRCDETANTIAVWGNGVSLDSVAQTFTAATLYRIGVRLVGTSIETWVDDTDKNNATSSHNETIKEISLNISSIGTLGDFFVIPHNYSSDTAINLLQTGVD